MPKSSDYVTRAKEALGDPTMSDRQLGESLGVSGSLVAQARYGNMSDPLAMKVAALLGLHMAEVVSVARAEREKDPELKAALLDWVPKTLAAMSTKTAPDERGGMAAMVDQLGAGQRTRRRAAAVVLSLGLVMGGGAPSPAEAAAVQMNSGTLCIMSTRRREAANDESFTAAA